MKIERSYQIVAVSTKSGKRTVVCPGPFSHKEACRVILKFTQYATRILLLEEI